MDSTSQSNRRPLFADAWLAAVCLALLWLCLCGCATEVDYGAGAATSSDETPAPEPELGEAPPFNPAPQPEVEPRSSEQIISAPTSEASPSLSAVEEELAANVPYAKQEDTSPDDSTTEPAPVSDPLGLPPELQNDALAAGLWSGLVSPPPAPEAEGEPAANEPAPPETVAETQEPSETLPPELIASVTETETLADEPTNVSTEPESPAPPAVSIEPIRLNAKNTRHLAWLLGAKATVVALADLAGVDGARNSQWEIEALADLLRVSRPNDTEQLSQSKTAASAVSQLIQQSRTCAEELSRRHGPDHAALMEIALKTNALLVLYESQTALALPVRRAVEGARARAALPEGTLDPLLAALDGAAAPEQVRDAVHGTHRVIERLLREGG